MQNERGTDFRQARVEMAPFYNNKQIDNIILEVEVRMLS